MKPVLLPVPRSVVWGTGSLPLPSELPVVALARQQELLPALTRFQQAVQARLGVAVSLSASPAALSGKVHVRVDACDASVTDSQGYRLTVSPDSVVVAASTAQGAAYGLATLKQLLLGTGRQVPVVTVEDHPDIAHRGVMLDISRGKVPTMASLYKLVDLLADLKVNEFQLYTEHTFAYRDHKQVWQDFSPMTGEEIMALDRYCRERFVDLVPNQNSFGHLTQWLIHDRYKHMAEAPDGWDSPWGDHFDEPFTLAPVVPDVIPFLAGLYDELLPHFSSPSFNVGCDETFDLGQGRSKEAVAALGEHRVYMDQLLKIHELVKARGRTMQFWGDILIKSPESVAELPKDVVALEWGYEAEHPFDERCAVYAKAGVPFYVCPGTSTWNSLAGRTDNALGNLRSAAEAGLKHGAIGFLNTIWGDHGHHDYQPVYYLPIAYGAAASWAYDANRDADVGPYLAEHIFGDQSGTIGQILFDMGNLYKSVGITPGNGSALAYAFLLAYRKPHLIQLLGGSDLDGAAARIQETVAALERVELTCEDGPLVLRELRNTGRLLVHLCALAKLRLAFQVEGKAPDPSAVRALRLEMAEIAAEHRLLWLARNRIGGLEEMSMKPFRAWDAEFSRMLG